MIDWGMLAFWAGVLMGFCAMAYLAVVFAIWIIKQAFLSKKEEQGGKDKS